MAHGDGRRLSLCRPSIAALVERRIVRERPDRLGSGGPFHLGLTVKLLIADDHPLFRLAVTQALQSLAAERAFALREADSLDAVRAELLAHPDIELVLLDLMMPGSSGPTSVSRLRAEFPAVAVAVISAHSDPEIVQHALALGALGFIPKSSPLPTIQAAVAQLLAGDSWVPPECSRPGASGDQGLSERIAQLTPQQLRVLEMVADGKLNKQIAWELGIQETTIKQHVSAILKKLGFVNRTQAGIALKQLMPAQEKPV